MDKFLVLLKKLPLKTQSRELQHDESDHAPTRSDVIIRPSHTTAFIIIVMEGKTLHNTSNGDSDEDRPRNPSFLIFEKRLEL